MRSLVFSERCAATPRRPQVLAVLPPGERSRLRFRSVIAPAVAAVATAAEGGPALTAVAAEAGRTFDVWDAVLEGVASSVLVLADLSPTGRDAETGAAYTDGYLTCLAGAALACRHPREVLLLRQEGPAAAGESLLPLTAIDFDDIPAARLALTENLRARLAEAAGADGPAAVADKEGLTDAEGVG